MNNAVCVIRRRDEGIAPYTITRGLPSPPTPYRGADDAPRITTTYTRWDGQNAHPAAKRTLFARFAHEKLLSIAA